MSFDENFNELNYDKNKETLNNKISREDENVIHDLKKIKTLFIMLIITL